MALRTSAVVVTSAVAWGLLFWRTDYPAHLLAGAGLAMVCTAAAGAARSRPSPLLGLAAASAIGIISELGPFGSPFNVIDVAVTILGAAIVTAAMPRPPTRAASTATQAVIGSVLVAAGLFTRHGGNWITNWLDL